MAVIELKGLQGLKGLSKEERDAWYAANPKNYRRTSEQADRVYRNQQFVERFGRETFDSLPNPVDRDKKFEDAVITDAFNQRYGNDTEDFKDIYSTEAFKFLLENNYQTEKERKEADSQRVTTSAISSSASAFVPSSAKMGEAISDRITTKIDEKDNKYLLEQALQIDKKVLQDREDIRQYNQEYKTNFLNAVQEGRSQDIDAYFEELLSTKNPQTGTPLFPVYEAYKDSYQIQNLDTYNKIDILSKFEAIKTAAANSDSEEEAQILFSKNLEILNDDIQHLVHEKTTFIDNAGKTAKMIGTKFYSNLGLTPLNAYALYLSAFGDDDSFNKFILGKDAKGNDLPWYQNIQYFSGCDQYNVFTVEGVNKAKSNGGISEDAILRDVGEEYSWFTGETLSEGIGMMGYIASSIGVDLLLTGGIGAIAKATGKTAMKQLLKRGVNPRTLVTMNRVFNNPATDLMTDLARLNIHSLGESGMEAATVAQEVYQEALDKQSSPEAQITIKQRVERDVQEQLDREFPNGSDRLISLPDAQGKVSARMLRADELRAEYTRSYTEDIAEEAAGAAYAAQATAMQLKNTAMDAVFKTYMFAKPFRTKIRSGRNMIDPSKTIYKNGAFEAKNFTWKDFAKNAGKVVGGGGLEEFTDNMVHAGAVELGLNYNNNYLQHLYNGDDIATSGLMTGAALAYLTGAESAIYDDGTYLEAFIGAISPVSNVMVNPTVAKYLNKKNRENFAKLSTLGKINEIVYNPLISSVIDTEREYQQNKEIVDQVNRIIQEHSDDFKSVVSGINAVKAFNELRDDGTTVDAKDSKFNTAFEFISNLNKLAAAGKQSQLFTDYQQLISEAVKGNITDDMIAEYLAQPENRNTVTEQGQENASIEAAQQIQKNAQSLLDIMSNYQKTYESIQDFAQGRLDDEAIQQLTYQTLLSKNWESRISEMEQSLTNKTSVGTNTAIGQLNEHGIESISKEYQEKAKSLEAFSEDGKLKGRLKKLSKLYTKLSETYKTSDTNILTADEILNLAPENRYRMMENHSLYTEEQVAEIEKAENILAQRDPDYRAKVRDIAILQARMEQNNESYKMILDKPESLMAYKMALKVQAVSDAITNARRMAIETMIQDFDALGNDGNAIVNKAKNLNSESLKALISARPRYKDMLSTYVDRAVAIEGLNNTVNNLEVSDNQKKILKDSLATIVENTSTEQEVVDAIEAFIDNAGKGTEAELVLREQMNEILDRAKDFNIVRNAAKADSSKAKLEKDRKAREAKDRRNERAKERRAQVKAEKERLAAEAERLRLEKEAKEKGDTMKGQMKEEGKTTNLKTFDFKDGEAIDLGIEYDAKTEEVQTPEFTVENEETIELESPTTEEETLPETAPTSEATQLRGNTLTPYNTEKLEEGKLVLKENETDSWIEKFYSWMQNAGIKFQQIIDYELSDIAKLNPVVNYLMVKPDKNATNDDVLSNTPLLAVEATEAIKKIHKEDRGGIIRVNGKEYLVIGMMGYAPNSNEQELWQNTLNKLSSRRDSYFEKNPSERFEVDDKFTTTIKELALGNLIKQLPTDSEVSLRTVSELLSDPTRNPYGLTWKDLSFAIQMTTGAFDLSRSVDGTVYAPKRIEENAGNVFLMIKASNGNYVPAAIKPVFLSEIRPGELQDIIDSLLQNLINPDHKVRFEAISKLKFLLNLTDSDNILIGTDKVNTLSLKENGVVTDTWKLDAEDVNRAEIFKKLKQARFRIQVTKNNLEDIDRLKQLDEAGVLLTDIALLATAGGHYTINATNLETGKPVESLPINSTANSVVRGSDLDASRERRQMVDGKRFIEHEGVWYDETDKKVENVETLRKINALNYIEQHNIPIAYTAKNGYDAYIIDSTETNPIVVMVNKSHNVQIARGTDAKNAIQYSENLKKAKLAKETSMEDVNLGLDAIVTEDKNPVSKPIQPITKKVTTSKEKIKETKRFSEVNREKTLKDLHNSNNLLTFVDIVTNSTFGREIENSLEQIFKDKGWGELPDEYSDIDAFLKSKDIPLPTELTQDKVNTWLEMIKDCK